jgi:hypothetical protein
MKVTGPMIERGLAAYRGAVFDEPAALVARILRAALNDHADVDPPMDGQSRLEVIDGETVIVDG